MNPRRRVWFGNVVWVSWIDGTVMMGSVTAQSRASLHDSQVSDDKPQRFDTGLITQCYFPVVVIKASWTLSLRKIGNHVA